MSEWKPIETAPRDGTKVLAWRNGALEILRWDHIKVGPLMAGWWFVGDRAVVDRDAQPTHWMPLPAPPTE